MEVKGVAVAAAVCMLMLLLLPASGQQQHQQQVAAVTSSSLSWKFCPFCQCYRRCVPDCKASYHEPTFCKIMCVGYCSAFHKAALAGDSGCQKICQASSICDAAAGPTDADAAACVDDCNDYRSRHGNHA